MKFFEALKSMGRGKPAKSSKRLFKAAQGGRLNNDWIMSNIDTNEDIKSGGSALVARSEDMAKNNSHFCKWLLMRERNIVGQNGIKLQIKTADASGRTDEVADRIIETNWNKWGRVGTATADGEQSWRDVLATCARHKGIYGEYFVYLLQGADNPYSFAVQVINPKRISYQRSGRQANGNVITMGIERNSYGRPIAYYVSTAERVDGGVSGASVQRIPADRIVHSYKREFAGQLRGIPLAHAAMPSMNMLDGYTEATLINARVSAAKMGFIMEAPGDVTNPDEILDGININDVSPGKIEVLPSGTDFKTFDPSQPTSTYKDFNKSMLREIANGLGISYNEFANDLEGVNYSSIRTGMLSERDGWKMEQTELIEHLCNRVFSSWLKMFLLTPLSSPLPSSKFDKFDVPRWIPRSFPWIDPLKDAQSNKLLVDEGWKPPQAVISEQGYDMDDVHTGIELFNKSLESHGLDEKALEEPTA